jgi:hypothetical protein
MLPESFNRASLSHKCCRSAMKNMGRLQQVASHSFMADRAHRAAARKKTDAISAGR